MLLAPSRIGIRCLRVDRTRQFSASAVYFQKITTTSKEPIARRLPKSLQKYAHRFVNAPISHVTSFIVLHELTAIIPLFGLWYLFHHYQFLPTDLPSWMLLKGTAAIERLLGDTVSDWSIQDRTRFILEGTVAYGLVKAAFPVRAGFSLLLTPWFARVVVIPFKNVFIKTFSRVLGRSKKAVEGVKTTESKK